MIAVYIYENNNIERITAWNQNEIERIMAISDYFRALLNQNRNESTPFRRLDVEKISNLPITTLRIPDVSADNVLETIDFLAKTTFNYENKVMVGRALVNNKSFFEKMISHPDQYHRIFQFIGLNQRTFEVFDGFVHP